MIRTATTDWVHERCRRLYLLINQSSNHPIGTYSLVRSGALAITSYLAYCTVADEERDQVHRATVVPAEIFQAVVRSRAFDIETVLNRLDFAEVAVARTRRFVALVLRAGSRLFIGVRGTVDAYDWSLNLSAWKESGRRGLAGRFHAGFLFEAEQLAMKLAPHLGRLAAKNAGPTSVFLGGHSLGGAIAAILFQPGFLDDPGAPWIRMEDCYLYGAPRIASADVVASLRGPFATRRVTDIVPRCPPSLLRFSNFRDQRETDGTFVIGDSVGELWPFIKWLDSLAFKRFIDHHCMERYRDEILEAVKRHPDVSRYWN